MDITIEFSALRALLFGILSCQCPVAEEVERALFQEFRNREGQEPLDLAPYLAIAERNPVRTPVHLFLEFCRFGEDDPGRFHITLAQVIRYFCTGFHFRAVLDGLDPLRIPEPAAHIVGHMLLPVAMDDSGGDSGAGVADLEGQRLELRNVFMPPEIAGAPGGLYGVHFGMALTPLEPEQARMALAHLALLPQWPELVARIPGGFVDYSAYQSFGDHRAHVAARHKRNS